ncbi:2489_t:CDS:2, partial [Rhizophagus irregularis]
LEVNLNDNDLDNDNTTKIDEAEQVIAFNLVIKPSSGSILPSKWIEIKASSLDDIFAEVHYYIGKLIDSKEIVYSDYSITFKPEKTAGVGVGLIDIQDYKKFLLDYKKLLEAKKNRTIVVSMKKKEKQKQKKDSDFEGSENENKKSRKKNKIPKLDKFLEVLQQEGNIIRELREKYKCKNHDACFVDNGRHLKLTAMHLQCWAKEIIRGSTDDTQMPNLPIFSQSRCVKENSQTPTTSTIPISFNPSNSNTMLPFFSYGLI